MRMLVSLCLLLVFCLTSGAVPQVDQAESAGFGTVEGRVLDFETGLPIPGATITAEPDDSRRSNGKFIQVNANESGAFLLRLPVGTYIIAASKESADYPDTDRAALASDISNLPRVVLGKAQALRNVNLRLEKGGTLEGTIIDSETQKPLLSARIRLTRDDHPKLWTETGPDIDGKFRFVIPLRPFRVQVSAPGYQDWDLSRVRPEGKGVVQLNTPESRRELRIVLVRNGNTKDK